jgi:signal transduction histidine kinase
LPIVQGIVALHGGEVRVDRAPLGGARFVCSLPVRP